MAAPTILVVLAKGFEEMEAISPVDILRRAGATVTLASLAEGIHVTGKSGVTLHADTVFGEIEGSTFDCLLLPGGPGVSQLRSDPRVLARVRRQHEGGGWIAAICAAPLVLKDAGLLEGRRYTAHPSTAGELTGALPGERVVADGRIITSRGAGTATDFGLYLVERLFSREKAEEISRSICA